MRERRGARRARRPARASGRPRATSPASRSGRFRGTSDLDVAPGVSIEQRVEPLARVGCYVPGGRFPLPSSLLMTAVPARVAGVREIIAVCPRPEPAVMAAALEAGVTRLFRVGGAHAIAALAYGTAIDSARRQDRRARQPLRRRRQGARLRRLRDRLLRRPDRDRHRRRRRPAGVDRRRSGRAGRARSRRARRSSSPGAGRSPSASPGRSRTQAAGRAIVQQSLAAHGAIDRHAAPPTRRWRSPTASRRSISSSTASRSTQRPLTAGAVFVGPYTAQAAGDYATGSNHVLPTSGAARFRGGLSAADFVRVMSVQRVTRAGLARLAPTIRAARARRRARRRTPSRSRCGSP